MAQTQGPQNKQITRGDGPPPPPPDDDVHPVIFVSVVKRGKKKKRGSSRASRRLEDIENRASKSVHRVTRAVNQGVVTYRKKRKKSERKRRDGALVDSYENAARGISKAVAKSAPALTDAAKALNTKRLRKRVRKVLKGVPVIG